MTIDDSVDIGSVTLLLNQAKNGLEPDAVQKLYDRYMRQLEWVARGKMGGLKRTVSDEEDIAVTVLGQFFLGVRNGRFPKLNDRHDLWQILLVVLDRRLIDMRRRKKCTELGESAIMSSDTDGSEYRGMNEVTREAITPEDIVYWSEQIDYHLQKLSQEKWRRVALWKLEQRTNAEIAQLLGCSVRQVERILEGIREEWRKLAPREG